MEKDSAQTFDRSTLEVKQAERAQDVPKEAEKKEKPEGDTTRLWRRIVDSRLNVGEILGARTPANGTPRPTKLTPTIPTKIEHPRGSARWANQQLEKAENLMEKWRIVDQIVIASAQDLEVALRILNGRPPEEAESLQSRIAVFGGEGVVIPLKEAARLLRASRAPIVQRLLIDRLEKAPTVPHEALFEMLGGLKNVKLGTDVAENLLAYLGLRLRRVTPMPGGEANLSAQTMINGLTGNFGMKVQHELGFADRLRPETESPEKTLENALKLAICMQDPKAIALAFARLGVEIYSVEPESPEKG